VQQSILIHKTSGHRYDIPAKPTLQPNVRALVEAAFWHKKNQQEKTPAGNCCIDNKGDS